MCLAKNRIILEYKISTQNLTESKQKAALEQIVHKNLIIFSFPKLLSILKSKYVSSLLRAHCQIIYKKYRIEKKWQRQVFKQK